MVGTLERFVMCENGMKFQFMCPQIKFYCSVMFILVPVVGSCLRTPVTELSGSQPTLKRVPPVPCPFTDNAGYLKPGPGFFTCNICATPWVSSFIPQAWLAALSHSACPPRAPHIRCEEGGS